MCCVCVCVCVFKYFINKSQLNMVRINHIKKILAQKLSCRTKSKINTKLSSEQCSVQSTNQGICVTLL